MARRKPARGKAPNVEPRPKAPRPKPKPGLAAAAGGALGAGATARVAPWRFRPGIQLNPSQVEDMRGVTRRQGEDRNAYATVRPKPKKVRPKVTPAERAKTRKRAM